jgi:hypothetical protein
MTDRTDSGERGTLKRKLTDIMMETSSFSRGGQARGPLHDEVLILGQPHGPAAAQGPAAPRRAGPRPAPRALLRARRPPAAPRPEPRRAARPDPPRARALPAALKHPASSRR